MTKGRLAIVMLLLLSMSCGGGNTVPSNNHEERTAVEVAAAELGNMTVYRDYTGTLEGIEQAILTAKVSETVIDVRVKPGNSVREGETLILLDKSGATSSFIQAKAYYDNAQKTLSKMKALFDEGAISEKQYDDAQTAFNVSEANFRAARDLVEIKAPVSGVVTDLKANIGDQTIAGQKLATVSRVDSLRLTIGVDPDDVVLIAPGMTARVYPVGVKDTWTEGMVVRVAGSADPKTRAFNVEILIAHQSSGLRPGSFAGCTIPLRELKGVVKVPDESILMREGLKKIYIVTGDTAVATDIVTGGNSDGFTEIIQGVKDGDVVVTMGQVFLQDRSAIRIGNGEADE
ncbi:MAG: efflux RND transporter periplasmic adaptor subunit [candidate division Zixibacteria bacterium]|nr:efflux RND transporter periplasmic adaptor subunit [candidate division Zixibacteria bacterium]MBU1471814.1 efflux RND transporter periplasmic adaptor subunit [candidate division Zixibacteria bacterium]MBU2624848.1 efflux RND transporter periplasmic adaptor subunit [candidate division Zixibacteria bacterium]